MNHTNFSISALVAANSSSHNKQQTGAKVIEKTNLIKPQQQVRPPTSFLNGVVQNSTLPLQGQPQRSNMSNISQQQASFPINQLIRTGQGNWNCPSILGANQAPTLVGSLGTMPKVNHLTDTYFGSRSRPQLLGPQLMVAGTPLIPASNRRNQPLNLYPPDGQLTIQQQQHIQQQFNQNTCNINQFSLGRPLHDQPPKSTSSSRSINRQPNNEIDLTSPLGQQTIIDSSSGGSMNDSSLPIGRTRPSSCRGMSEQHRSDAPSLTSSQDDRRDEGDDDDDDDDDGRRRARKTKIPKTVSYKSDSSNMHALNM